MNHEEFIVSLLFAVKQNGAIAVRVMMDVRNSCYCCTKPPKLTSGMDIDVALNELGMLSTVTDSRREYLQERARQDRAGHRRDRNLSEPGTSASPTPSNSPSKGTYQILQMNPQYVISLSTTGPKMEDRISNISRDLSSNFGAKYSQENIEYEVKTSRVARTKLARLKRFRKPYEVPWRNSTGEHCYRTPYFGPLLSQSQASAAAAAIGTPEKTTRGADRASNSNTSTPEKQNSSSLLSVEVTVPRSKSLDELDFAKLRLAEAENHNFILEKKEIDKMSQHLQNLQVNE